MNEVYYQNMQIVVLNFSNRLGKGDTLTECEFMLYEQACRLTESVAKNLRRSWGVSNNANDLK